MHHWAINCHASGGICSNIGDMSLMHEAAFAHHVSVHTIVGGGIISIYWPQLMRLWHIFHVLVPYRLCNREV